MNDEERRRRGRAMALRAAVSILALALVFRRVDLATVLGALGNVGVAPFSTALAAHLAAQLLSSLRWMLIVRGLGLELGAGAAAKFYFIGMFFNLFAPSTLGADVTRTLYVRRSGLGGAAAATSVVADRVVGLVWLVVIAAIALATLDQAAVPRPLSRLVFALAIGMLVVGVLALVLSRRPGRTEADVSSARALLRRPSLIARASALSLLVQLGQVLAAIALVRAVAPEVHWTYSFVFQPLVAILGALPISLAGLGVRESGYVYFLATLRDVPVVDATAFALAWLAVVTLSSLVGAVVLVVSGEERPSAAPSDAHSGADQLPSSS